MSNSPSDSLSELTLKLAELELECDEIKRKIQVELRRRNSHVRESKRKYSNNVNNLTIISDSRSKIVGRRVRVFSAYKNRKGDITEIVKISKKGTTFDVVVIKSAGYSEVGSVYRVNHYNVTVCDSRDN